MIFDFYVNGFTGFDLVITYSYWVSLNQRKVVFMNTFRALKSDFDISIWLSRY